MKAIIQIEYERFLKFVLLQTQKVSETQNWFKQIFENTVWAEHTAMNGLIILKQVKHWLKKFSDLVDLSCQQQTDGNINAVCDLVFMKITV